MAWEPWATLPIGGSCSSLRSNRKSRPPEVAKTTFSSALERVAKDNSSSSFSLTMVLPRLVNSANSIRGKRLIFPC